MFSNNEIGTLQPIREIGAACRKSTFLFLLAPKDRHVSLNSYMKIGISYMIRRWEKNVNSFSAISPSAPVAGGVVKTVAEEQGISEKYLEQIIPLLVRSGLVRSVRGARGGYQFLS